MVKLRSSAAWAGNDIAATIAAFKSNLRICVLIRLLGICVGGIFCGEPWHIPNQVRGRLAPENASTAGRTRGPSGRPCVRLSIRCYLPQPACLLQASCALGLAFSHCVIERVSLFDILLFMQVQYLRTTGALWPSSLLSLTQAVIHLVSSALWRCACAGRQNDVAEAAAMIKQRLRIVVSR